MYKRNTARGALVMKQVSRNSKANVRKVMQGKLKAQGEVGFASRVTRCKHCQSANSDERTPAVRAGT